MHMRRAASISEQVLEHILPMIRPEVTELDIAAEISYQHKSSVRRKTRSIPLSHPVHEPQCLTPSRELSISGTES